MSFSLSRLNNSKSKKKREDDINSGGSGAAAKETDPLLLSSSNYSTNSSTSSVRQDRGRTSTSSTAGGSNIRVRRSPVTAAATDTHSTTPPVAQQQSSSRQFPMLRGSPDENDVAAVAYHDGYESVDDSDEIISLSRQRPSDESSIRYIPSNTVAAVPSFPLHASSSSTLSKEDPMLHPYRYRSTDSKSSTASTSQPPAMLEIPEEIYLVRKAALQVLKPLTKTWVVISVGFALTVLFGMARWTRLMPGLPFWCILLPCWSAHVGLLCLHISSARALSSFIAQANESRQRPDSRDHLNRTEYLPLLQRSLKYGFKTGILSFFIFVFEILIYIRLARGSISLTAAFTPCWLLVLGGIADGFICKTQHYLRVICWVLAFVAMILLVLKVDYGYDGIRWRVVVSPVLLILSIASGSLIYIVYGHQIGYYRLTESQLTAGNLYSLAALICIVLVVMIGEVIPLSRPVEIETRLFVVLLAPLVVCLVGMGAWVVSRDEFGRLLLFGGQSAVLPMRLRWEAKGWTSVQGRGVSSIPMFGEVAFQPLERKPSEQFFEMCSCCSCTCYPYEEEEDDPASTGDSTSGHAYLDASSTRCSRNAYNVLRNL